LLFAVALVPYAGAQTKSAAKSRKATGTIISATDTNLVISSASKKESTFVLNADTKKTGAMTPGEKVSVTYKMDGKDMVATSVKASAGSATTASAGGAAKSTTKKKTGS
jgi:predicted lysophospholipase L1 biosynthesis ABC-type transport system permease subunit